MFLPAPWCGCPASSTDNPHTSQCMHFAMPVRAWTTHACSELSCHVSICLCKPALPCRDTESPSKRLRRQRSRDSPVLSGPHRPSPCATSPPARTAPSVPWRPGPVNSGSGTLTSAAVIATCSPCLPGSAISMEALCASALH